MASVHPPAELEALKALLAAGLSQAKAGQRLGLTSGAVSGLVRRMRVAGVELPHRLHHHDKPKIVTPQQPNRITIDRDDRIATAVPLRELADHSCRWPVAGEGRETLFCGNDRNGSWHRSYCKHHALRSVEVDAARVRPRMMQQTRAACSA